MRLKPCSYITKMQSKITLKISAKCLVKKASLKSLWAVSRLLWTWKSWNFGAALCGIIQMGIVESFVTSIWRMNALRLFWIECMNPVNALNFLLELRRRLRISGTRQRTFSKNSIKAEESFLLGISWTLLLIGAMVMLIHVSCSLGQFKSVPQTGLLVDAMKAMCRCWGLLNWSVFSIFRMKPWILCCIYGCAIIITCFLRLKRSRRCLITLIRPNGDRLGEFLWLRG